jgi:20S proteasome alpha/beta subunit
VTLIVGIKCSDGVVVASDSAATFSAAGRPTIGQQDIRKVVTIRDHILFSSSGAVGISQIVIDRITTLWDKKAFRDIKSPDEVMDKLGKEILQLINPYLQSATWTRQLAGDASMSLCKSLVAMPVNRLPHLFNFDYNGAPERATPEVPFVSLGIGQPIADPFLALLKRLLWPTSHPTVAEGTLAAVWCIKHVSQTNPGGVGGEPQLATMTSVPSNDPAVKMFSPEDIEEHLQRVATAEEKLVSELRGETTTPPPEPPAPETQGE